jgi:hypothetical protein
MRFRRAVGLALVGLALSAPAAAAWEKLPYTRLKPNDSEVFSPQATPGIPFSLKSPLERMIVSVLVSPSPVTGLDGLIVPGDSFRLLESNVNLGQYSGLSNGAPLWWTSRPGRYYWQVMAVTRPPVHVYFGPVKSLRVG